jgi:hypothetical protein
MARTPEEIAANEQPEPNADFAKMDAIHGQQGIRQKNNEMDESG